MTPKAGEGIDFDPNETSDFDFLELLEKGIKACGANTKGAKTPMGQFAYNVCRSLVQARDMKRLGYKMAKVLVPQSQVVAAVEALDALGKPEEDAWTREEQVQDIATIRRIAEIEMAQPLSAPGPAPMLRLVENEAA